MFFLATFVLILVLAFGCWSVVLVSLIGVYRNFKNESDRFSSRTLWNPLNALARPDFLTERGLLWRQRVFRGAMGFVTALGSEALLLLCMKVLAAGA